MTDIIQSVLQIYKAYSGTSFYMLIVLIAIVYLFVTEKNKTFRMVVCYLAITFVLLFFTPVFAYLIMEVLLEQEIYYRMLWFVPCAMLVSYAGVQMIIKMKGVLRRGVAGILLIAILSLNGSCVFTDGTYKKAENAYHVPQVVVDIVELIKVGDCNNICVFPPEIVQYVRQVDADLTLCYGREMLVERWGYDNPVYDAMIEPVYDIWKLQSEARRMQVTCIVLDNRKEAVGDLHDEYFDRIGTIGYYDVYVDRDFNKKYYKDYLSEGK